MPLRISTNQLSYCCHKSLHYRYDVASSLSRTISAAREKLFAITTLRYGKSLIPNFPNQQVYSIRLRFIHSPVLDSNYVVSSSKSNSKKTKKKGRQRGRQSYRFIDRTRVQVSGGSGGNGSLSMYKISRKHKRRPDGGHGGNGGSVTIVADPNEQSLRWTIPHVVADAGTHGSSQGKRGRNGKNTILRVPCGVVVRRVLEHDEYYDEETKSIRKIFQSAESQLVDAKMEYDEYYKDKSVPPYDVSDRQLGGYLASNDYDSDEEEDSDNDDIYWDVSDFDDNEEYSTEHLPKATNHDFTPWGEKERVLIADLDEPGSHVVVAKGGRGGLGSSIFASKQGPCPPGHILSEYAKPKPAESALLELELKLIADVGLVGFPNAGKSSLLSATSRATPHIAAYPFTTLNPFIGYIEYRDGFRVCAADVPGLIEGASHGRGKGHDFLRHLERTKALLYIVDAAGMDGRDPVIDLEILIKEVGAYGNGDMLNRRCLVVANKVDLLLEAERKEIITMLQERANVAGIRMEHDVISVSAGATGEGLPQLTKAIRETVISSEVDKSKEIVKDQ